MPSWDAIKIALACCAVTVVVCLVAITRHQSSQIASLKIDLKGARESAAAWEQAHKLQIDLAEKTAAARADETRQLLSIRDAAGTAKEGIANAPGASDRFRYSDSAYRFMQRQPQDAGPSAPADAPVD